MKGEQCTHKSSGDSGVYIGGSGVAIIAAGGERTYIATVNHP